MARKVAVIDYQPEWQIQYAAEAENLRRLFGMELIDISHIGSTSVPGLKAKPIIDILIQVRRIDTIDELNQAMIEAGYVPKGEFGVPGRRYFFKGTDEQRTHHVHVYESRHPEVIHHLAFRDYLRVHPEAAQQYGALKESLAKQFSFDIQSYMDGKDAFIKQLQKTALDWKRTMDTFPEYFAITEDEIDLNELLAKITLMSTGAAAIFTGMVRGVTSRGDAHETEFLEYEAYIPMAEAKMKQVADEIRARWNTIEGIAMVQRIGKLYPKTPTVLIACTAAHRDTGVFEGARYGIDRLKEIVPVWKKEVSPDGQYWVEGDYTPKPGE